MIPAVTYVLTAGSVSGPCLDWRKFQPDK
jgi:hypothetical protein